MIKHYNRKYSSEDIKELERIKKSIMTDHSCGGVGYIEQEGENVPCNCMKLFKYVKELYYSQIPQDYWFLTLDKLKVDGDYKGEVGDYLDHIDRAVKKGLGMLFSGPKRGIGKTSLMSIIGKVAIQNYYQPYYVLAQNIVDDRFTKDKQVMDRVAECDILLIDELDKISMGVESNIPKHLENIFREILPNKKPVIMCTNFTEEEIEDTFTFMSLLDRYVKVINMEGQDYSKKLKKKWEDRLHSSDEVDYRHKVLISESKTFFNNIVEED
jgi:DNA replication protein DnaC